MPVRHCRKTRRQVGLPRNTRRSSRRLRVSLGRCVCAYPRLPQPTTAGIPNSALRLRLDDDFACKRQAMPLLDIKHAPRRMVRGSMGIIAAEQPEQNRRRASAGARGYRCHCRAGVCACARPARLLIPTACSTTKSSAVCGCTMPSASWDSPWQWQLPQWIVSCGTHQRANYMQLTDRVFVKSGR